MTEDLLPPHNLDSEEAVIASILIDASLIKSLTLLPEDFYGERNLLIYEAMTSLNDKGTGINQVTVAQELQEAGNLEVAGGAAFLSHVISICPTSFDCQDYADIVRKLSIFRRLNQAGMKISNLGLKGKGDIDKVLAKADEAILTLRKEAGSRHVISPKERAEILFERYESLYKAERGIAVSTGLVDLDYRLGGGMFPGEYIILAARPSMGKTTLAECISNFIAGTQKVLFCSTEMDVEGLSDRDVAGITGISVDNVRMGGYSEETFMEIVGKAVPLICERNVYHLDATYNFQPNTANIYQATYELQTREGLSLVVVDCLGQLTDRYGSNDTERLSYISRTIKAMAKTLKIPFLCIHHLNRAVESRTDKVPELHDLRGSGSFEQDADVVMFLYRESYYDKSITDNITDIFISKKRQGRGKRRCQILWNEERNTYLNLAREEAL